MRSLLASSALSCLFAGCVSYGVGTTAATVAPGEHHAMMLVEATPAWERDPACVAAGGGDCPETPSAVRPMVSNERRIGIDERSDWGVRVIGHSGLVASYKRRLTEPEAAMQMAVVGGAGLLNVLNTLAAEATVIVSARESAFTPYGGVRMQQTVPLTNGVGQDAPTLGVFAGARLGSPAYGISPEVGIYYDPSVLRAYDRSIVVVPVITLHGQGLLDGLF